MEVMCCFCEIILLFQDRDMFIAGNSMTNFTDIIGSHSCGLGKKKKSCINKTKEVK